MVDMHPDEAEVHIRSYFGLRSSNLKATKLSRRLFLANGLVAAGTLFLGHGVLAKGASSLKDVDLSALKNKFSGQIILPDNPEFTKVAYGGLWNKLHPSRLPQIIARVANEQDVVEAVRFAKANKIKVVVRGGGHNWCAPSLRNNGMMIDVTNLNQVISIDEKAQKAVLQPIVSNRDVQKHLNAKGMAFPSGHCPQVKISGYLLSGGMAWNQGVWGPGVGSVEAIELVTPDGELITADKDQNTDYFWAARGAACGFFGVVVKYHLKIYPLPKYITASSYAYSLDDVGTVAGWLSEIQKKLPGKVELSLWLKSAPADLADKCKNHNGKLCMVTASTFADSAEEAKEATKLLDECPVIAKCLAKTVNENVSFEKLLDMSGDIFIENARNHVEACFSNADPKELFNALKDHFAVTPSAHSVIMFAFFTGPNVPAPLLPDAAFSMSAHLYGGPWTMWKDEADDEANAVWQKKAVAILKPFTAGHYVSETDTVQYPDHIKRSYSPTNLRRIEELRKKYDPNGVFFAFSDGLT